MLELCGHLGPVRALAYAPNGRSLASGSDDATVRLWQIPSGECSVTLASHKDRIRALSFDSEGQHLISGAWDDQVIVHRFLKKGPPKSRVLSGQYLGGVWSLAVRPGENDLIVGAGDGSLAYYSGLSKSKPQMLREHQYPISGVAWSPDGRTLATVSYDRAIRLWEGDWLQTRFIASDPSYWLHCLAWSPSGSKFVVGEDASLLLWSLAGEQLLPPLEGHSDRVVAVQFSPDGERLFSASWDGTLRTWSAADGRQLAVRDWGLGRIHALALSPDGMTAAVGYDRGLFLWDTDGAEL